MRGASYPWVQFSEARSAPQKNLFLSSQIPNLIGAPFTYNAEPESITDWQYQKLFWTIYLWGK
jgi:hypothetical protein